MPAAAVMDAPNRVAITEQLMAYYQEIRCFSEYLCEPLATEDYVIQSMPDVSPAKWHLAHTSWFFETFVLKSANSDYRSLHPQYDFLFNSYYNSVGERHCRVKRGILSRPTVEETYQYRRYVDQQMLTWMQNATEEQWQVYAPIITLGFHHEQQHQELIVTDIKHVFSENPLNPVYRPQKVLTTQNAPSLNWRSYAAGLHEIGHASEEFAFDNEGPPHQEFLQPFQFATRLTTNGEYMDFMEDGGYQRPEFWLSAGWATVRSEEWQAPLYWEKIDGDWWTMTLSGLQRVNPAEPVCHVSYYEADAYAQWAGARLATESEWEVASGGAPQDGNFVENGHFQPIPAPKTANPLDLSQMFGDVWEWTRSPYSPYPGYHAAGGALGEYNGKFMCNQYVLRGGSCATSRTHIRSTYRNFFPPDARWQFSGIRLAKDA